MYAAQSFAAFQDLKDLTQATDAELAGMLAFGCSPSLPVSYEDVVTEHIMRLFRHITGVDWVRGWEQGARPDKQYGTIWMFGAKTVGSYEIEYQRVINGATSMVLPDLCEVSYQTFEYQFQLDVYRDNGTANRNQDITTITGPRLSAVDVMLRLITAMGHPRFREALAEKCIYLGSPTFGPIRNLAKPMIKSTYEGRASVDFYVRVRPISSLRSPTFGTVDWGFVCPTDAQLHPDPPLPVVC
jgi:hypothetical protein